MRLKSPAPNLWVGNAGEVTCSVERRGKRYKIIIRSVTRDVQLLQKFVTTPQQADTIIRPYGFTFNLSEKRRKR